MKQQTHSVAHFVKTTMAAMALGIVTTSVYAQTDQERIQTLEEKVELLTSLMEEKASGETGLSKRDRIHFGGYGEMHYNQIKGDDLEKRGIDFHRLVIFMGYDFSDSARFVSELEIEHAVSSASKAGEVEVEQAYLEFDLGTQRKMQLKTGIVLMPIGIVNETHEPATFYGVERPIIETVLIPSTWWAGGVMFSQQTQSGISYDLFVSEGLKTADPNANSANDPFDIKGGKQKTTSTAGQGGKADAFDLAMTGRIKYTGVAGLELAAYAQYQPDLDQSAKISYADAATLIGGHAIYEMGSVTMTGLYARWMLEGAQAKAAKKDTQDGGYVEVSYQPTEKWGVFARQSSWQKKVGERASQTDIGVNYWPLPDVVFKADYQVVGEFASRDTDSGITTKAYAFNLCMGDHV